MILSIGHSKRSGAELVALLAAHGVACVCDIRALPRSRRYPQFERAALAAAFRAADIDYEWWGDRLGGLRKPRPDSPNHALLEPGFRGFADYMQVDAFRQAVQALVAHAATRTTAMLCAEAAHERCHRRLIADYLELNGTVVAHIVDHRHTLAHRLHPALGDARDPPVYNSHPQGDLFA